MICLMIQRYNFFRKQPKFDIRDLAAIKLARSVSEEEGENENRKNYDL
jgi:hypothetical protein